MSKLDGISVLKHADELKDFVASARKVRKTGFRIDNTRVVERKFASGHKVQYVNRGSFQS